MNKSKGKKAGKICENILFVIGILGIVILYWYDRSITLDPNIKESYTGEYPRYVSEVNCIYGLSLIHISEPTRP